MIALADGAPGASRYDTARLSRYLFVPDDLFPSDVAIVFGMTNWRRPVARALDLHRAGLARRLVFTGGYNHRIAAIEAVEMAGAARLAGVPDSDILIDDRATNTAENALNALREIDRVLGIGNVNSALLVAIHFHMRRVRMTVDRAFPGHVRIGMASYPSEFYTSDDWHACEKGRSDAYSEADKIGRYLGEDLSHLEASTGEPVRPAEDLVRSPAAPWTPEP